MGQYFEGYSTRATNIFNQSAHWFTLSIANQNAQKTIENEEKTIYYQALIANTQSQAFAVEKNNAHRNLVLQVVSLFFEEIFTLSGSR